MTTSATVSLLASSARTTTGSGAAVDLVEKTTLVLYLDVTAIDMGAVTLTVETSPNGTSGWTSVVPLDAAAASAAFAAASAVGLQKVVFPSCERYVRASWSISGGGTATFSVTGSAFLRFCSVAGILADDTRAVSLGGISYATIDKKCGQATDEIVSALAVQQYEGPFTAWGSDVEGSAETLAFYYSLLSRGFKPDTEADPIVQALADARAWLDLVTKGQRRPFGIVDATPTENEGSVYIVTDTPRGW